MSVALASTPHEASGLDVSPSSPVAGEPVSRNDAERLAVVLKALADPTRLDVFRLIAAQEAPICACDVVDRFAVSQPTISHHLRVLREAGLITVSRRGVWAYYAADPRGLALLQDALTGIAPARLAAAG